MFSLGFIHNFGWLEIGIILLIVLLFFGHRLPGLGKSLGRSVSEFKGGLKEGKGGGDEKAKPAADKESTKEKAEK